MIPIGIWREILRSASLSPRSGSPRWLHCGWCFSLSLAGPAFARATQYWDHGDPPFCWIIFFSMMDWLLRPIFPKTCEVLKLANSPNRQIRWVGLGLGNHEGSLTQWQLPQNSGAFFGLWTNSEKKKNSCTYCRLAPLGSPTLLPHLWCHLPCLGSDVKCQTEPQLGFKSGGKPAELVADQGQTIVEWTSRLDIHTPSIRTVDVVELSNYHFVIVQLLLLKGCGCADLDDIIYIYIIILYI